jgi:hypothetical protein
MSEKASSNEVLPLDQKPEETEGRAKARHMLHPAIGAATVVRDVNQVAGVLPLPDLVSELTDQMRTSENGSLVRSEEFLVAHIHTLDALFAGLSRRALSEMREYFNDDAYGCMRLALKAQSQCKATIEALASVKNPRPVAYVQQNIGNAVQVNNAACPPTESVNRPNELLEHHGNELLDSRAAPTSVGADSAVAAVGPINGTQDGGG